MKTTPHNRLLRPALIIAAAAATATAQAQNTWVPATGGTWATSGNWSTGVPLATDEILINNINNAAATITLDGNSVGNTLSMSYTSATATTLALTATGANRTLILGGAASFSVNGASTNLTIGNATAGQNINLTATTLTKSGTGTLDIKNASTIGNVTLEAGTTIIGNATSLGSTGTITLGAASGSATHSLRAASITLAKPIALGATAGSQTINNTGGGAPIFTGGITGNNNNSLTLAAVVSGTGSIKFNTGAIDFTGTLLLRNNGTATVNGATSTVTIDSAITNKVTTVTVQDTTINGAGITRGEQAVVLSNTGNAWTGNTTVTSGILRLAASNVLPDGAGKGNVAVTGTLDMRGTAGDSTETINGLTGGGTITRSGASGTSTLTVGGNDASSTFTGTLQNTAGTLALTKTGSGTLTLSGTTTYSGATAINGGTLRVNTTLTNTSGITIGNGAKFEGTGAISSGTLAFSGAGTLSAGNSIGILGLNNVDLSTGTLLVEYGTSSIDLVNIAGLLDVDGATVNFSQLSGALDGVNPYVFATYGSLSGGTFSNVQNLPNGYAIDYGDGSNSALSLVAVPEPKAALLGGMGILALLRRRRSNTALG